MLQLGPLLNSHVVKARIRMGPPIPAQPVRLVPSARPVYLKRQFSASPARTRTRVMAQLVLPALVGLSTTCVLYLINFSLSILTAFVCRSTAQPAVVHVVRVSTATPKALLRAPPAQQVRGLPQARLHRVNAKRGIQTACRPVTNSATEPAVSDSL